MPKNTPQITADVVEATVLVTVGTFAPLGAHGTIQLHAGDGDGITVYAGKDDPTVTPPNAGVYLRRIDATHVELWVNAATGWTKVA